MKVSNNRLYWIINFFIFFLIIYFCSTSIYAEEETPLEEINNYEIIEVLDDETNISTDSNEEIILNNEDESHGNDSLIESGWKIDENGNLLFLDENGVPIQGWFQTDICSNNHKSHVLPIPDNDKEPDCLSVFQTCWP